VCSLIIALEEDVAISLQEIVLVMVDGDKEFQIQVLAPKNTATMVPGKEVLVL